jgi:hypothetical protein
MGGLEKYLMEAARLAVLIHDGLRIELTSVSIAELRRERDQIGKETSQGEKHTQLGTAGSLIHSYKPDQDLHSPHVPANGL